MAAVSTVLGGNNHVSSLTEDRQSGSPTEQAILMLIEVMLSIECLVSLSQAAITM
jgi:hypothetical protein